MAVGKGSINRVSKAVDDKLIVSDEVQDEKKEISNTRTTSKKPATKTSSKSTSKPATRRTTTKKKVVSKPSEQVEKIIKNKALHYGVGSSLPTYLM